MVTRGRKRKLDLLNGREGPGEQSGQQPDREQGPSQLTVNGGLQQADGRWLCPFCNKTVGSEYYLPVHVRRDHEGFETSRGEEMTIYLQYMSRWLCGKCYLTSHSSRYSCTNKKCGGSKENQIPGQGPAGPTFRWPSPEREQTTEAAMGEEVMAMATETQDLPHLPNLDQVFSICAPLVKYVPKCCRDLWADVRVVNCG